MALKIRLRRMGRKKAPSYRIVVAESSMPRDGRFVTSIGHYNPRTEPVTLSVDREKALYWISQGATPTDTARSLMKRAGVFGPAPAVTEEAVAAVKEVAKKTGGRARQAAAAVASAVSEAVEEVREVVEDVAEEVRDVVEDVVEEVRERLGGEEEETEEGADAEAEAEARPAPTAE